MMMFALFAAALSGAVPGFAQQVANALAAVSPSVRIAGREARPEPVEALMRRANVPGLSIAIIREGKVAYAKGFGVADSSSGAPVTVDSLFQAASVSKPVTASGALALVDSGRLDLDRPVNAYLTSWRIPDSPMAPGSAVTLRQLLSHTAGLNVHGFGGYAAGAPLPTLAQVLEGAAPANSEAVRITLKPGSEWRYSGGGYTVLQQLLTDVGGRPMPELMQDLVLGPAGMSRSAFVQPPSGAARTLAVTGHSGEGKPIPGGYRIYPELAAAGLWTNPSELARWAIAITDAYGGKEGGIITPATARAMLTPGKGEFGLGLPVLGEGAAMRFTHSGVNEGFRALLIAHPNRRDGVVIMANGDNGGNLFGPISLAIAPVMGWNEVQARTITPAVISRKERADVLGRYAGGPATVDVAIAGDRIIATQDGSGSFELIPLGKDAFSAPDIGVRVEFKRDPASRRVVELVASGGLRLKKVR